MVRSFHLLRRSSPEALHGDVYDKPLLNEFQELWGLRSWSTESVAKDFHDIEVRRLRPAGVNQMRRTVAEVIPWNRCLTRQKKDEQSEFTFLFGREKDQMRTARGSDWESARISCRTLHVSQTLFQKQRK